MDDEAQSDRGPSVDREGAALSKEQRREAGGDIDWAKVRRAYELSAETVGSIRKRFGLSRYQLEKRRRAENWTTRPQVARKDGVRRRRSMPNGSQDSEHRLDRLVSIGLAMLEKTITEEGMTEAHARTLTELARAQEVTMRSQRNKKAAKAREKKNNDAGHDFRDDPDWLLAEINRRLDRLAQERGSRGTRRAAETDPQRARGHSA